MPKMPQYFRQLVFCPDDPLWISNTTEDVCRALGLIAEAIDEMPAGFYIGQQFLQHINFMGCAPAIEFVPDKDKELDWQQFTFVNLSPLRAEPVCHVDLDMAKPQCPRCNKRIRQPRPYVNTKGQLSCPHCQHAADISDYDWREFGGCARTMVSIVNVYPKEAIPTDHLLLQFERHTQIKWRYFYFHGRLLNEH